MAFFKRLFTWWNGATLGTLFSVKRGFVTVGEDASGNTYHEAKTVSPEFEGRKRRWVIYKSYADPTTVPAEWHGWLHHTYDEKPDELNIRRHDWQLPHKKNLTGTPGAYKPKGSLDRGAQRNDVASDYEAWTPGD